MRFSDKAVSALKEKESRVIINGRHVVYDDSTGKPIPKGQPLPKGATIGYGHLVKNGEDFSAGLTEQQATELYRQDIKAAENIIKNYVNVSLEQNQYDALVIFAYNIGWGQFKNSTVLKYINNPLYCSNVYKTLEDAWKAWNKSGDKISNGLINRRNFEWNLYVKGVY